MVHKHIHIQSLRAKFTRWTGKPELRRLFLIIGLYVLSNALLPSLTAYADAPIERDINLTACAMSQISPMTLPDPIFRHWTHSREEDQGDILVYRPSEYPFPRAWGRDGLEFRKNGELLRYQIGPTDRSVAVLGRWRVKSTNIVEIQFSDQSNSSYALAILECNETILKVRQIQDTNQ